MVMGATERMQIPLAMGAVSPIELFVLTLVAIVSALLALTTDIHRLERPLTTAVFSMAFAGSRDLRGVGGVLAFIASAYTYVFAMASRHAYVMLVNEAFMDL